jgi:hypothetical protein
MEIPAHSLPRIRLGGQTASYRMGTEATQLFNTAAGERTAKERLRIAYSQNQTKLMSLEA